MLHAVGWYFPESSGGTEVYVDALARHLRSRQVDSQIVAAHDREQDYVWNDTPVHRYAVSTPTRRELTDALPPAGIGDFERWLRSQQVDVYHQHSWSRGCGVHHLRIARQLGMKTVLTVHVPNVICLRGTMLEGGTHVCDGHVQVARCSACWGEVRGIPPALAGWLGEHPTLSDAISRPLPSSRAKTVLSTPAFVSRHQAQLSELWSLADRVVAVAHWLKDALAINGAPASKTILCLQGIDSGSDNDAQRPAKSGTATIGFLGRWDRVKGIHVLVDAMRKLPRKTEIRLVIHALAGDANYERQVRERAAGDARIEFGEPLSRDRVNEALRSFDALAIPSQWLETGPLVLLEAQAAGVPVLGADLGGIAELLSDPTQGTLIPAADVDAWSRAMEMVARPDWRARPTPPQPRSAAQVAAEMATVYEGLAS